jgi:hypothetical protein
VDNRKVELPTADFLNSNMRRDTLKEAISKRRPLFSRVRYLCMAIKMEVLLEATSHQLQHIRLEERPLRSAGELVE